MSIRLTPKLYTDAKTLQGLVNAHSDKDTTIYTDENRAYVGLSNHETISHRAGEYVRGDVHTNGIESFWAMLKRAHKGTFHKMSPKHLQRYVNEFSGRHNMRDLDTVAQMETIVAAMIGKRLTYTVERIRYAKRGYTTANPIITRGIGRDVV